MIALPALIVAVVLQPAPAATPLPGTNITPLPQMSGSPVPGGTPPAATPAPGSPATPLGTASPSTPAPAASAAGTPIPFTYRFVPRQPEHPSAGEPQILAVYLNSRTLVSQGPIDIKVVTDSGTVKVTSRSNGREGVIPMVGPGDFEAYSKLPKIPFIAAGMTVRLEFTAVSADGRKVSVQVPVALK